MVIDVGASSAKKMIIGSVLLLGIGLVAIIAGVAGSVDGGSGGAIAAIAIGAVFLLIGLIPVLNAKKAFRPRKLIFEPPGLRWDDPRGRPWAIAWAELAAVSISKHGKLQLPESAHDRIVGAAVEKVTGENVLVRLDFFPADPGAFRSRHPELEPLWQFQDVQNGYRLPLGRSPNYIPLMAQGLAAFAPNIYKGVQTTEGFMGLA